MHAEVVTPASTVLLCWKFFIFPMVCVLHLHMILLHKPACAVTDEACITLLQAT